MRCPPKAKITGSTPVGCAKNQTDFCRFCFCPTDKEPTRVAPATAGSTTSRFWKCKRTKIVTVDAQAFMPSDSCWMRQKLNRPIGRCFFISKQNERYIVVFYPRPNLHEQLCLMQPEPLYKDYHDFYVLFWLIYQSPGLFQFEFDVS